MSSGACGSCCCAADQHQRCVCVHACVCACVRVLVRLRVRSISLHSAVWFGEHAGQWRTDVMQVQSRDMRSACARTRACYSRTRCRLSNGRSCKCTPCKSWVPGGSFPWSVPACITLPHRTHQHNPHHHHHHLCRHTPSPTLPLPSIPCTATLTPTHSQSWLRCALLCTRPHHLPLPPPPHCRAVIQPLSPQVYAPLFAYHFWNATSALDCTPANRSSVTECALADPLVR